MIHRLVILLLFFPLITNAAEKASQRNLRDLPAVYRDSQFQFFPIPFFETQPGAGQRYGLMPTLLWYDKNDELITILVGGLTYNPKVVKLGGFGGIFLYPSELEKLVIWLRTAQHFERDYEFYYENERLLEERLDLEFRIEYMQDPFERFYGFGPESAKSAESNFVSHKGIGLLRVGYEIFPKIDLHLQEDWLRLGMHPRALPSIPDTGSRFAGNREVAAFNQWVHRFSAVWDERDDPTFPKSGHYLEPYGLLSHEVWNTNDCYGGYGLIVKNAVTLRKRFTTVAQLHWEKLTGDAIPFYLQNRLGGENDLRAFVNGRFTGRGKVLLDIEERIFIKRWNIMNAKFDFSVDPFFAVGQVFDRYGQIAASNLQPVGGVGFRAVVPPSVLGRVDIGIGTEGMEIYTTLDYPF